MPKLPGRLASAGNPRAGKAGFRIVRQSSHVVLSNGSRFVVVPRNNPINAFTMGGIVRDAGFTVDECRKFLYDAGSVQRDCFHTNRHGTWTQSPA